MVYNPSLEAHIQQRSKCPFAQTKLEYLSDIISVEGVSTDPSKTEAMLKWHVPTIVSELRRFLGLIGYYRKFVQHYGIIAKPLTQLLKMKQLRWNEESQHTFDRLKKALSTTPVLALPNFKEPFIIETDVCDVGLGQCSCNMISPWLFSAKP